MFEEYWSSFYNTLPSLLFTLFVGNGISLICAISISFNKNLLKFFRINDYLLFFNSIPLLFLYPIFGVYDKLPNLTLPILFVFYPSFQLTLNAFYNLNNRFLDAATIYGGSSIKLFQYVYLRAIAPTIIKAIQISIPNAFLGVILVEYLIGSDVSNGKGLGHLFLTSIAAHDTEAYIYATIFIIASVQLIDFLLNKAYRKTLNARTYSDVNLNKLFIKRSRKHIFLVPIIFLILLEISFRLLSANNEIIKTPLETFYFLYENIVMQNRWPKLFLSAFARTFSISLIGLMLSLLFSVIMASICYKFQLINKVFILFAQITQSIPMIVFLPLIVFFTSRGFYSDLLMAVSASFFPIFLAYHNSLLLFPKNYKMLKKVSGENSFKAFLEFELKYALKNVIDFVGLIFPKVVLGVLFAEMFISGVGLGFLFNEVRGSVAFKKMWVIIYVATIMIFLFTTILSRLEDYLKMKKL